MDHGIYVLVLHELVHEGIVTNVAMYKTKVVVILYRVQIRQIPCIRQRVQHYHSILRMLFDPIVHKVGAK